uniref:Pecanex-like protein n=1 Tax=Hydatigena taeniaeformis TaxID=6205 RepID=A0A0R3WXE8_HYDTA
LVTSMKLLRHGFSGATRMFLNFFFAEVLFTCDFPGLSETFPVDYFFVSIFLTKASLSSFYVHLLAYALSDAYHFTVLWEDMMQE